MTNTNNNINDTTNKSNWIIIPKYELQEMAKQKIDIEGLISILEEEGNFNPSLLEYIIIPDGRFSDEMARAVERSIDLEMEFALYNHILTHPNNATVVRVNPEEMCERLFPKAQELVAGKVNGYARHNADHVMIMSGHTPAVSSATGDNPQPANRETFDRESAWIVISKRKLRELAKHETSIKCLIEKIEIAGDVNPDKCDYIRVMDGQDRPDDECIFASDLMIDGEILTAARYYLERYLVSNDLSPEQCSEMTAKTYDMLLSDISEIAEAYAIGFAEQAMGELKP